MRSAFLRTRVYLSCIFLILTSAAFAQTFQQAVYSSPNGPSDLFVADLNHDGKPDIVATQNASNMVTVFLNHGDGTFTSGGTATYLTGRRPSIVVVADFNGDGIPDIATANCDATVSVLFGNGDGTFRSHVDYPLPNPGSTGYCPSGLGFMLVGHDTAPSLITTAEDFQRTPQNGPVDIVILRNNGSGTFTQQIIFGAPGSFNFGVSAADYNHDGIQDITAIFESGDDQPYQVVVYNGNADGSFSSPHVIASAPNAPAGTNTVDFTGDGIGDLLVPHSSGSNAGMLTLANNGSGQFNAVDLGVDPVYGFVGSKAAEGDFNNNGLHELLLPVFDSFQQNNAVALFPASSRDSWTAPIYFTFPTNTQPNAIATGDFNNDHLLDFAVVNFKENTVRVFTNTSQQGSCPSPPKAGIGVCSPTQGSTVSSPVRISATANGLSNPIVAMKAYLNGKQVAASSNNMLNASVPEPAGNYTLTINAWDSTGKLYQAIVTFSVGGGGGGGGSCAAPGSPGVAVCSPAQGSTVSSPVAVSAAANGGANKISAMKAYVDGKQVAFSSGNTVSASVPEAVGNHTLTVNAWDVTGKLYQKIVTFAVH